MLVKPVGFEALLQFLAPPVEMRLALHELDGAAGEAGALRVELFQLPCFVVDGPDAVPVPRDRLVLAVLER